MPLKTYKGIELRCPCCNKLLGFAEPSSTGAAMILCRFCKKTRRFQLPIENKPHIQYTERAVNVD